MTRPSDDKIDLVDTKVGKYFVRTLTLTVNNGFLSISRIDTTINQDAANTPLSINHLKLIINETNCASSRVMNFIILIAISSQIIAYAYESTPA